MQPFYPPWIPVFMQDNTTTNVYIRGLSKDMTDSQLLQLCQEFGSVLSCKAILDLKSGICKGFGFVLYQSVQEAHWAINQLCRLGYIAVLAHSSPRSDSVSSLKIHSIRLN